MIIRTRRWLHSTPASFLSIIGLLLLGTASLLTIAGQACGGSSLPDDTLYLVPDDASSVTVEDVQLLFREAPNKFEDAFESNWKDDLHDIGVSTNDLATIVTASVDDEMLVILEGRLDFEQIRDKLDDAGQYQGHEMWKGPEYGELWSGGRFAESVVALIEDHDQAVIGSNDVVKSVLRDFIRGSGSLFDNADREVARVLKKVGHGWTTSAHEECNATEFRGCQAMGYAIAMGSESSFVEFTLAYLFRDEGAAESQMDDLEKFLDDGLPRKLDIEEVRLDGEFVLFTITMDEDGMDEDDWIEFIVWQVLLQVPI